MIDGHGDDIYKYEGIRMNFSSNIYAHADLSELEAHLGHCMHVIHSYPEPSPHSLERMIADKYGIDADEVLVTSGATEAIYLIAQAFRNRKTYHVIKPTFAEYEEACHIFDYEENRKGALCWLCNPNNPQGMVISVGKVKEIARSHELMIIRELHDGETTPAR